MAAEFQYWEEMMARVTALMGSGSVADIMQHIHDSMTRKAARSKRRPPISPLHKEPRFDLEFTPKVEEPTDPKPR